ncbi:universal stress protein [Hymenobacter sp. YC55]|uniref:universal stress protein n=1 Tax=Hymenobacter sp. YC55 TaxID=3034019 RepID=UPI0023F881D3|nr:universal stress protein [Hymenobacter sp. YC55]MDF7811591.1 universal stress protein [Hymenobacter sp. YC55]
MTTLLIVSDFVAGADPALDFATLLAQALGAKLVLLHVQDEDALKAEPSSAQLPAATSAPQALQDLARTLPVPAVAEVEAGQMEDALPAAISRHRPALIVLSRPSAATAADVLVTTTALNVLRSHACGLLVVPAEAPQAKLPQRVLLAADGGKFTLGPCVESIRAMLLAMRAQLIVGHVTESATQHTAQQALASVVRTGLTLDLPAVTTTHVCHAEPTAGILQAVAEQRAELLAVVARPHTLLWSLFRQTVTAQLVLQSAVPVLVLPAQPQPTSTGSQASARRTTSAVR